MNTKWQDWCTLLRKQREEMTERENDFFCEIGPTLGEVSRILHGNHNWVLCYEYGPMTYEGFVVEAYWCGDTDHAVVPYDVIFADDPLQAAKEYRERKIQEERVKERQAAEARKRQQEADERALYEELQIKYGRN